MSLRGRPPPPATHRPGGVGLTGIAHFLFFLTRRGAGASAQRFSPTGRSARSHLASLHAWPIQRGWSAISKWAVYFTECESPPYLAQRGPSSFSATTRAPPKRRCGAMQCCSSPCHEVHCLGRGSWARSAMRIKQVAGAPGPAGPPPRDCPACARPSMANDRRCGIPALSGRILSHRGNSPDRNRDPLPANKGLRGRGCIPTPRLRRNLGKLPGNPRMPPSIAAAVAYILLRNKRHFADPRTDGAFSAKAL